MGGGEGREGTGQSVQRLVVMGRTLTFAMSEVGAKEGSWVEEGIQGCPLATAGGTACRAGKSRSWKIRAEVTGPSSPTGPSGR